MNTYPTSSLFNNVTKSERGFQTLEVKDRQGRVTHKYQQYENGFNYLITGYVYNDLSQLIAVIPPEAYKKFGTGTGQIDSFTENDVIFKEGIYGYHYDDFGRLIEKHVPGAGWTYFVYDKQDRIVMSADDSDKAKNFWHFQKYDALGRKIQSGIQTGNGINNRAALQTAFDLMTTETYEERGTTLLGYTNRSFPIGYGIMDADIKEVIYYDDFLWNTDANYNFQSANAFHGQGLTKGLVTGTLIRNIETNAWYKNTNHYDYKGRIIQSFSQNNVGGIDRTDYGYRFNNEVLSIRLTHRKTGENDLIELYQYDYDHLARKTLFRHTKGDITQTVASYRYDNLGRLLLKNIKPIYENGSVCTCPWIDPKSWSLARIPTQNDNVIINPGTDITISTGSIINAGSLTFKGGILRNYGKLNLGNFGSRLPANAISSLADPTLVGVLQIIDYKYHIRGGLRGVNLDANNNTSTSNGDLFSMKLGYETDGYFDGNIGKQEFKNSLDNVNRSFTYSYDGASRITGGAYVGAGTENYSLNAVTYDANGNIKTLSRSGYKSSNSFGLVDDLVYTYQANSNKIQAVSDLSNETASFKDATGTTDYTYLLDGSLTSDANKGITLIEYNYLKLPKRVVQNGVTTLFQYDATGKKLKETIGTNFTDYVGNKIYKNGALYQIVHDEGRIVDGQYEYFMNDHLGNLRVSFRDSSGIAKITQKQDYDPYGAELQKISYLKSAWKQSDFKFSGKEFEQQTGLNDFGWRRQDPILGRMWGIDYRAEKYYDQSPMNFALNNPLRVIEVDGDTVNVSLIQGFDNKNGTNYLQNIINDLNTETGLNLSVSSGQLQYQKDSNGNPVIATDKNGNQLGSSTARGLITKSVNSSTTGFARLSVGNSSAPVGGVLINLNAAQINSFINGATNVDSKTLGFGMTFMHEMLHSTFGGGLRDVPAGSGLGPLGKVVPVMNTIRGELNSQGGNYGQRTSYEAVYDPTTNTSPSYLPFDNASLRALQNGNLPPQNSKYIKF